MPKSQESEDRDFERAYGSKSKFIEALEHEGYEPGPYSGRGMFGKQCVSVSGEDISQWALANYLGRVGICVPEPRQDSLGLGVVLYWPSYQWPQEKE